jgi:hypothetical protein
MSIRARVLVLSSIRVLRESFANLLREQCGGGVNVTCASVGDHDLATIVNAADVVIIDSRELYTISSIPKGDHNAIIAIGIAPILS